MSTTVFWEVMTPNLADHCYCFGKPAVPFLNVDIYSHCEESFKAHMQTYFISSATVAQDYKVHIYTEQNMQKMSISIDSLHQTYSMWQYEINMNWTGVESIRSLEM
jgi:hypothetical protein